ncbi:Mismatch repair endonuclease pms2 [Podila minutissima]|nr:Mismatch repair endonuclease pms2 [Podila minutissima]
MSSIKAIDKESVHRICSGQVVLDMATAVKELLENSLDAGSTSIVVKFKQSGLEYITVTDNGSGITDENLETLALKHYTSKLRSFNDLAQVRSFGFRGEALSSLCALATLTVTTSTGKTPTGVLVEYTSDGTIRSKTPAPMTRGTIVKISSLFEGMPVRRSEFVKNIKREYTKCIGLIQAYALIATNVRISCVSQTDKKPAVTYVATSGNSNVRQNIINVFGAKSMTDIIDFHLELVKGDPTKVKQSTNRGNGDEDQDRGEDEEESGNITLTGHISSPSFGKGRSSADRQYLFINGRPCTLPKITRVVNEVYHSFNTNQSPFLIANLVMPTSFYDVNVSPDKRTIFLHNERMIVEEIRNKLTELFEPSRSTFAVSEARHLIKKPDLATRHSSGYDASESRLKSKGDTMEVDDEDDEDDEDDDHPANNSFSSTLLEPVSTMSLSSASGAVSTSSAKSTMLSAAPTFTKPPSLQQTTLLGRVQTILPSHNLKRKTRTSFSDSEEEQVEEEEVLTRRRTPQNNITPAKSSASTPPSRQEAHLAEDTNTPVDDDSTVSLNVLEGYDPLDDRTRDEVPVSDSEDEDNDFVSPYPSAKVQRVVVLDSEIPQDPGDRDWVEVGFDMLEQRRKRELRMKILKETRRVEKEQAELRKEQAKKRAQEQEQDVQSDTDKIDGLGVEENPSEEGLRRSPRTKKNKKLLSNASFANMNDAEAQKSLSRVISKSDFARMKVLGQFNKAFIVARLDSYSSESKDEGEDEGEDEAGNTNGNPKNSKTREPRLVSSDIFVIDQHASDEKYNFEILQAKTVFSTQKLFQPKKLYLTAQEEIVVVDHMKMLNKNGFYLDYDPDAPVSHRLKLVTLPVSERVVFDLQDFEELVFLLSQQTAASGGGDDDEAIDGDEDHKHHHHHHNQSNGRQGGSEKMVRCSKVRNLFASRACRRSVMIGHVLNHGQMKRIVRHMGEIDQPWNCPHGRPTMRHLLDLAEMEQQERRERFQGGSEDGDDEDEVLGLRGDRTGAFDPVALKRPTRHQGNLFKQFLAMPKVSL